MLSFFKNSAKKQAISEPKAPLYGEGKGLGYRGELSYMLDQNMTVKEAISFHLNNWGYEQTQALIHEVGHILYALTLHKIGRLENINYQGSYEAECFVLSLEFWNTGFDAPQSDQWNKQFLDQLKWSFRTFNNLENYHRTLLWLIGQETGHTMDEIWEHCSFEEEKLYNLAALTGIDAYKEYGAGHRNQLEKLLIRYKGKEYGIEKGGLVNHGWPSGSNGQEEFKEFTYYNDDTIKEVYEGFYDAMHAAHKIIHDSTNIHRDFDTAMASMTMRELYETVMGTPYEPQFTNKAELEKVPA